MTSDLRYAWRALWKNPTTTVGAVLALALVGVVVGGLAAVALGRFVETQLYSVQPLDVVSFAATAGIMIATALIASLVPALRALRVDPISALRGE